MKHLSLNLFLLLSLSLSTFQDLPDSINHNNGIALQGYDPVSYFQGKPKKGIPENTVIHEGVKYFFIDSKNLMSFNTNPEAYIPAYGGWCAYAMGANGDRVDVNPETYKVVNGKLFLFYNAYFNNTLKKWNKNEPELLVRANENWNIFLKEIKNE